MRSQAQQFFLNKNDKRNLSFSAGYISMLGHPMSSRFSFGNIRINAISRFYDSFVICDENLKKEINIRESINTFQVKQEDIKKL